MAVIALFLTNIITGVLGIVLLAVSAILVITSMVGVCPLYIVMGLSSAGKTISRKVE
jgi:hypothetical protein